MKKPIYWSLAFLLILVVTYPASPTLYQLLIISPTYSLLIFISFILILSLFAQSNSERAKFEVPKIAMILVIALGLCMFISYVITFNPSAIRELFTLLIMGSFIYLIRGELYIKLFRYYSVLLSLFVVISIIIYVFLYFLPELRSEYLVQNLNLNEQNPIIQRSFAGDFEYSMIFKYAVVLSSERSFYIPSIFSENTFLFLFILGPLFFVNAGENFNGKNFVIIILGAFSIFSLTLYPLLVISFGGAIVCLVLFLRPTKKVVNLLYFLTIGIFILYGDVFLGQFLQILPSEETSQYNYYFRPLIIDTLLSEIQFFGSSKTLDIRLWGPSAIFLRYGYLGASVYLIINIILLNEAMRLLIDTKLKKMFRVSAFMALFTSLLLGFKAGSFLLLAPLLIYLGLNYYLQSYAIKERNLKSEKRVFEQIYAKQNN